MITCPACGSDCRVVETRPSQKPEANYTRRRRMCASTECGTRVVTIEVIVENSRNISDAMVVSRSELEDMMRLAGRAVSKRIGRVKTLELLGEALTEEPDNDEEPPVEPVTPSS